MVKFMAGLKGEGKTKKLISMANEHVKTADGHLVFIDDDRRHTREINRDIRFVEVSKGTLSNYREFIGFILGILSQNSDIQHIYIDGITNIIKTLDDEALVKLQKRLELISKLNSVAFTISINIEPEKLPDEIKGALL